MRQTRILFAASCLAALVAVSPASLAGQKNTPSNPVFGVGWTVDSLANLEVGRFRGRSVSYRFRAERAGTVSKLRVFFIFRKIGPGEYADGNGGTILIEVVNDDGSAAHLPSREVLASTLVTNPLLQWNREVEFTAPAHLQAGKLYHIVFSNTCPDPVKNYVSVDDLYTTAAGKDLQPSAISSGLTVLFKSTASAGWEEKYQHAPIIAVLYDDGFRQGQGYIDVKHNGLRVEAPDSVREVFTVPETDRRITQLAVRFQPASAHGRVKVTIATESGEALKTALMDWDEPASAYSWKALQLGTMTLAKNARYTMTLEPETGSSLLISPLQKGAQYGFEVDTLFTEGRCETRSGGQWTGCLQRSDLDIPFYLQ